MDDYRAVSKASPLPLYHQVLTDMRRRIQSGTWKPGQRIPSELELCTLYGTSRITIRQAVQVLVEEGLLRRERGKGTFVKDPTLTAGIRGLTSFTEEMAALGHQARARVLAQRIEPAPTAVAERMHLPQGEPVVLLKRLRYAGDEPIGLQTAYLPARRFPGLERADLANQSLYRILDDRYGVTPTDAEETFTVVPIMDPDARLLRVEDGSCGFRVRRLTFAGDDPFEYVISLMRGDRYEIKLALHRAR